MRAVPSSLLLFGPWILWWGNWFVAALAGSRPGCDAGEQAQPSTGVFSPRIDVLVPAHDEEASIVALLESLGATQGESPLGRVLVVADHCTDATAELARANGAEVVVRDSGTPGKPAALRAGLSSLAKERDRGEAVLIVDADCSCSPGFVAEMSRVVASGVRAAQASNLSSPTGSGASEGVAFGMFMRNYLRPRGQSLLGIPVQLTGTGPLLTWQVIDRVTFGDELAEDTKLSYDLVAMGVRASFVPSARVTSPLPPDDEALASQRRRWEGGQASLWRSALRAFARCLSRRDLRGALAVIDWSTPPLVPVASAYAALSLSISLMVVSGRLPIRALAGPLLAGSFLAGYVGMGLHAADRGGVARSLPAFVIWKARFYAGAWRHRGGAPTRWRRTRRATDPR